MPDTFYDYVSFIDNDAKGCVAQHVTAWKKGISRATKLLLIIFSPREEQHHVFAIILDTRCVSVFWWQIYVDKFFEERVISKRGWTLKMFRWKDGIFTRRAHILIWTSRNKLIIMCLTICWASGTLMNEIKQNTKSRAQTRTFVYFYHTHTHTQTGSTRAIKFTKKIETHFFLSSLPYKCA